MPADRRCNCIASGHGTAGTIYADGHFGELTYDYSCHLLSSDEQLACACETLSCRGMIGPFELLPKALRRQYLQLGVVSPAAARPCA